MCSKISYEKIIAIGIMGSLNSLLKLEIGGIFSCFKSDFAAGAKLGFEAVPRFVTSEDKLSFYREPVNPKADQNNTNNGIFSPSLRG